MNTAQTPREAAEVEAARQAVMLVFGLAGAGVLLWVSQRQHQSMARLFGLEDTETRMRSALADADRWDAIARWCFVRKLDRLAREAHRRAERARAEYEAARP